MERALTPAMNEAIEEMRQALQTISPSFAEASSAMSCLPLLPPSTSDSGGSRLAWQLFLEAVGVVTVHSAQLSQAASRVRNQVKAECVAAGIER